MQYQDKKKRIPSSVKRSNSTGYKGVKINGKKFQATISIKFGKKVMTKGLGSYLTPEEAYCERIKFISSIL